MAGQLKLYTLVGVHTPIPSVCGEWVKLEDHLRELDRAKEPIRRLARDAGLVGPSSDGFWSDGVGGVVHDDDLGFFMIGYLKILRKEDGPHGAT